jgi:hypothetical protein
MPAPPEPSFLQEGATEWATPLPKRISSATVRSGVASKIVLFGVPVSPSFRSPHRRPASSGARDRGRGLSLAGASGPVRPPAFPGPLPEPACAGRGPPSRALLKSPSRGSSTGTGSRFRLRRGPITVT